MKKDVPSLHSPVIKKIFGGGGVGWVVNQDKIYLPDISLSKEKDPTFMLKLHSTATNKPSLQVPLDNPQGKFSMQETMW